MRFERQVARQVEREVARDVEREVNYITCAHPEV